MAVQMEPPERQSLLKKLASPAFLKHKQEYIDWSKTLLGRAKKSIKKIA